MELPESLAHCWYWFLALNNTRPSSVGISAIPYHEMKAYFTLLQLDVEPWEIEVVKMFDHIAMKITEEQNKKEQRSRENKNKK